VVAQRMILHSLGISKMKEEKGSSSSS
jgi:hypothetical protein